MNKSKNHYINTIVRTFLEGRFSRPAQEAAMQWLASDKDEQTKEESLREVWDETLATPRTRAENEEAHEAYRSWKSALMGRDLVARRTLRIWQGIAACMIIGLGVLTCLTVLRTPQPIDYIHACAPSCSTDTIALPDGTTVILNSGSTLLYPERFEGKGRDVFLTGEACFTVAKDKKHPFTVHADDFHVRALGTCFNVNAHPENDIFTASLIEGSVKVTFNHENDQFILSPNEQLSYNRLTGKASVSRRGADEMTAWQRGELIFSNATLPEILSTLRRRFDKVDFIYSPSRLPADHYSFRFRRDTPLPEMMQLIADVAGNIEVTADSTCVSVMKKH